MGLTEEKVWILAFFLFSTETVHKDISVCGSSLLTCESSDRVLLVSLVYPVLCPG